jgi:T5SS/PEP-CTERM-associated repeat protein
MKMKKFNDSLSSSFIRRGMAQMPKCVTAAALVAGLLSAPAAHAAITWSGDLNPADTDPSTWTSSTSPAVGFIADGTLTVDGGSDLVTGDSRLGHSAGVTGIATVTGSGSTWTAAYIRVGYSYGTGIFNITNGASVTSRQGLMGGAVGATDALGIVTIDGAGSTWTGTGGTFTVGNYGTGIMKITNGGTFTNSGTVPILVIAHNSAAKGTVIVDGSGSKMNIGSLYFGGSYTPPGTGLGKLSVGSGGAVTVNTLVRINTASIVTTDLGRGSSLSVGSGTLTNNGTIRLVAGAGAANGAYTPITAGTWDGSGSVQALGGIWNATDHTVSVSTAATGAAGTTLSADLAATQRFLFTDGSTGKSVGAALKGATTATNVSVTASAIGAGDLGSLQTLLGEGQAVLGGCNIATTGYAAGDPIYLSLSAGAGQVLSGLGIWSFDGSAWNAVDAADLTYDGKYANFTTSGPGSYAVTGTAPVPIPAAAWLLGSGVIGLAGIRRRKSGC